MSRSRLTNGLQKGLMTAAVVVVSLGLFAGSASAQTGVIEGTVSDAVSSLPIEGAIVMARGSFDGGQGGNHGHHPVVTDQDGVYIIEDLAEGEYTLRCGAADYLMATLSVVVDEGQTTVQDIALEPLTFGSVDGLVTDAVTGLPIAGARVMLRPVHDADTGGDWHWLSAVTGDDGMYFIENVLAGEYEATARAFGYLPNEPVLVSVSEGATSTVDLALDPLAFGSAEGTVTDAVTGDPIDGARVSLTRNWPGDGSEDQPDWGWHHAVTDENGFYRFDQVEVSAYTVTASANGYIRGEAEIEVLDGQTTVTDLALSPLAFGSVEGTVTGAANSEPIERALVVILPNWMERIGEHDGWWMARTDENGFYRFDEVPADNYRMMVFARRFIRAGADVEVLEGQTTTVDFVLEPHSYLDIRVR
jgi:hypothetical protein